MQDMKTILKGHTPDLIAGDDLETEIRKREARKEREATDLFNQGEGALRDAARDGIDIISTASGQLIQSNRAKNNKFKSTFNEFRKMGMNAILDTMLAAGASLAAIQEAAQILVSPSGAFSTAASRPASVTPDFYEDETHVYETQFVSRNAHRLLATEVARVRRVERQIRECTDPAELSAKKAQLAELVEEYQMRLHPLTGKYVHSAERATEEELRFNPDNVLAQKDCVFIYREKPGAHDSRKRSVVLGDQYDQQTIEVIATDSSHAQGEARPIAPPELHHI